MKKAALFLALAAAFLLLNRAAYRGYFQDDELDNIGWTQFGPAVEYWKGAASPLFFANNFRPPGHFFFHEGALRFGLDFPKWVAAIQALHLLNVALLWLVLRRMGLRDWAAAGACAFFGLHMALFDAFWKPMYVFDVLCGTFSLASLLLWMRRQWVLSFLAFWLAYKSKEVAVMLPAVLTVYELWLGKRQWKPLAAFWAAALSFGVQAAVANPHRDDDYTFRLTAAGLGKTVRFYGERLLLIPFAAWLLPIAAWRGRRAWFGLAACGLFLLPMLFLPGRMAGAYCYVPLVGLAVAMAAIFERWPVALAALALWAPFDIHALRVQRNVTLARDRDAQRWVTTLAASAGSGQAPDGFIYDGAPAGFAPWGMEGAIKFLYHRLDPRLVRAGGPPPAGRVAVLRWDGARHRLDITLPNASY